MDFLSRDEAPFSDALWEQMENQVLDAARKALAGRRFLPLYGPLGAGAHTAAVDSAENTEHMHDGFAYFDARKLVQIPQLYEDFWLYWRDMAYGQQYQIPLDFSPAYEAGTKLAFREDSMIFYGVKALQAPGLLNAEGVQHLKRRGRWDEGENAFADIGAAAALLMKSGKTGQHTLLISPDIYLQLQRIQPGTGLLEAERLSAMLGHSSIKITVDTYVHETQDSIDVATDKFSSYLDELFD